MMSLIRFTSFILILGLSVSCATTQTGKPVPPELRPAYTALEVLTRVQELQKTVIGLYDANPRGITKANADIIVLFTTSTATILQTAPAGWQQTVVTSWMELKDEYIPTDPTLKVIWALTDSIITQLVPVQDK